MDVLPSRALSSDEDPGMNFTPMIDVVFQLLVFFLLSLKFKTVDRRLDSLLPKDRSTIPRPVFVDELPLITAKLFRIDHEHPERAFTRVRIGNRLTVDLPAPDDPARPAAAKRIRDAIAGSWAARGHDASVKGEIKTPRPKGELVPHGDVMLVLDAYLDADLMNVVFEGSPSPLPVSR